MVFSSATFLFAFLPVTLILYFFRLFPGNEKKEISKKNIILLLSSLLFYAWGEPVYVLLMMLSILFNYLIGRDMEMHRENKAKMRLILIAGLAFNIFALGFFKYSGFIADIFSSESDFTAPSLPVGISFYTFQIISYIVDVYRGTPAQKKIVPFACYITMFPQLIAGPIVQYGDIEKQLYSRKITSQKMAAGIIFFIRGLGKKVLFANTIGAFYTEVSALEVSSLSVATAWLGIICYTLQIYFDFSGYSDMAVGLGKMLGFDFYMNFNFPYKAKSVTEFWRRWHISLGNWFRDYVYIPLGGNRVSIPRNIFNILTVWTLTGLWHGAAWNFIAWGALYGLLLIIEKFLLKKILDKIPSFIRHAGTMLVVMIGWVFFSHESFTDAFTYIKAMFGLLGNPLTDSVSAYLLSGAWLSAVIMSLSAFGFFEKLPRPKNFRINTAVMTVAYMLIFILSIAYLISETYNPFLYFRF
ncbi:MAG: MBOAT family protein [Ruminococcaceae bacterium]|nr:MBOAT family protein [Oscillospiraceae bacterium]